MTKCNVCGKDILKHSEKEAMSCLKEANISLRGESPLSILSRLGIKVTFNHKHGWIKWDGGEIEGSKDMNLDFLRLALTSDVVKGKPKNEALDNLDDLDKLEELDELNSSSEG
jgi:hypothetical protein